MYVISNWSNRWPLTSIHEWHCTVWWLKIALCDRISIRYRSVGSKAVHIITHCRIIDRQWSKSHYWLVVDKCIWLCRFQQQVSDKFLKCHMVRWYVYSIWKCILLNTHDSLNLIIILQAYEVHSNEVVLDRPSHTEYIYSEVLSFFIWSLRRCRVSGCRC